MAGYRKLYPSFWYDSFVLGLKTDEKLFYIYLMTNDKVSLCGIYELPLALAAFELGKGFTLEKVLKMIQKFQNEFRKIVYSEKTSEIVIVNWLKYNNNPSPKVQTAITSALNAVKDKKLIQYLYGIDTVSIPYTNGIDRDCIVTVIDSDPVIDDVLDSGKEKEEDTTEHDDEETAETDEQKHKRGEYQHVLLKDSEYQTLQKKYGNADELVKYLDEYIEEKGYKAKSHYLSICRWVVTAVKDKKYRDAQAEKNGIQVQPQTLEEKVAARAERLKEQVRRSQA